MAEDTTPKRRLRSTDLSWREARGEIVILDQRRWLYFSLNGSAALLWASLAAGATTPELADRLRSEYGIEEAAATADSEAFIAMLAEQELLEP